jgi:pimeloyl-ACP methyl ester carboxylesterase
MESKYIRTARVKLHYVEAGKGPLLILLHGFPEFWYSWRYQIDFLSQSFRLIVPDMRGYNLSEKPAKVEDYRMELLAEDIAGLIEALGEKEAFLAGHDWGAAVAWATAAWYPTHIRKLAILNVPHPAEMERAFKTFNLRQWLRSWYIFFFQIPLLPERILGTRQFFENAHRSFRTMGEMPSSSELDLYVQAFSQDRAAQSAVAYYRAAFRSIFFAKNEMPLISCPVLMLWGVQDKALGKELTFNTAAHCACSCEVIYHEQAGHFVHQDDPQWVNHHLLEFFTDSATYSTQIMR